MAGQALHLLHASACRKVQKGVQHQPLVQLGAASFSPCRCSVTGERIAVVLRCGSR